MESKVNKFTGNENSRNDKKTSISLKDKWKKDFQLTTMETFYCHSGRFAVDQEQFKIFKMNKSWKGNVIMAQDQLFSQLMVKWKN